MKNLYKLGDISNLSKQQQKKKAAELLYRLKKDAQKWAENQIKSPKSQDQA